MDQDKLGYGINGRSISSGVDVHQQSGGSDNDLRRVFETLSLTVVMLIGDLERF